MLYLLVYPIALILCAGCAETVVRAGSQCGVILSNGVMAWVPCANKEIEMTKHVRIENADTSDHHVSVFAEDLIDGVWVRSPAPTVQLLYPTEMHTGVIYQGRRLVIEEAPE